MDSKIDDKQEKANSQGNFDSTLLVSQFQKIVDSKFAKFILKKMTTSGKFEHVLGVFAGVEESHSISETLEAKTIEAVLSKAMKTFDINDISVVKAALKDLYVRKGVSTTLRSIAKYGVTRPQVFVAPLLIVWNITKQCNLKCLHCYANAGPFKHKDELTLEEKLNVVDQLADAGVPMISFSGGEPLISPDFWKVADYAHKKGMYTSIATNGTTLTKENVEKLKQVGVQYIEISLDAPEPKTHDMFRGVQGAWARTVEGIKNAVAAKSFDTGIATTATKYNLNEIPQMIDLAIELGVKKFIVFNFIPTGRGKDIIAEDLSPKERTDLLNYLYDRWQEKKIDIFSTSPTYSMIGIERVLAGTGKTYSPTHFATDAGTVGVGIADFIGGCGAGRLYAAMEDNGDVEPCVFLPIKVGNIREKPFAEIWENSKVMQDLRNRDIYLENCKSCIFRNACGGCRARGYAYFGNYLAPDPGCELNKDYYNKILEGASVETKNTASSAGQGYDSGKA
ncbi:MAG: radical SAM protein [Candidatus Micrarchaeaceae archaeon]